MKRDLHSVYKEGAALQAEFSRTRLPEGSVAIWHLGQAGVAIKGARSDGFIAIDPYLTFSIEEQAPESEFRRGFPPPVEPAGIVDARAVLVTHSHDDHLDLETLTAVSRAGERTVFVVPAPSAALLAHAGIELDRIIAARDGDHIGLEQGAFRVQPVAEAHTEYEVDESGDYLYLGYCITVDDARLFHAGDCLADDRLIERVQQFEPDVVFLPINGRDHARAARGIVGNMNYRDAADFAVAVQADLIVPIHYDLFANNRENPAYFVDYLFHTYPAQKFHMPVAGERFIYMKSE
jgi:L-ascorbate 6-phosphate lactonase